MSPQESPTPSDLTDAVQHELHKLRKEWWWFLLLGILLIVCGLTAISYPFISSVSVIIVLGAALMIAGVATIVSAFFAGKWSGLLLQLLIGILYTVVGFTMMDAPIESLAVLTLFLAAFFIMGGIFRIVVALSVKFPQWGWALLSGVITLLLGIVIFKNFRADAFWVIGLLVGVELLFNGWTWIMTAVNIRNLPDLVDEDQ